MKFKTDIIWYQSARILERLIALLVLLAVVAYIVQSLIVLIQMDWSHTSTLYELIYRMLIAIIGVELVRMLVTHSISAVLELIAFVIARKMLKPDLTATDIFLSTLAFVLLMAARHFFVETTFEKAPDESKSYK